MKFRYLYNDRNVDMEVNEVGEALSVTLPEGITRSIDSFSVMEAGGSNRTVLFDLDETDTAAPTRYILPVSRTERGIEISYSGRTYVFNEARLHEGAGKRKRAADTGSLIAPMVGLLAELFVAEGDTVAAYQPLAIVEAMKVMATIEAPFAGKVKHVYVKKGAQMKHGQLIIEVVATEGVDL